MVSPRNGDTRGGPHPPSDAADWDVLFVLGAQKYNQNNLATLSKMKSDPRCWKRWLEKEFSG